MLRVVDHILHLNIQTKVGPLRARDTNFQTMLPTFQVLLCNIDWPTGWKDVSRSRSGPIIVYLYILVFFVMLPMSNVTTHPRNRKKARGYSTLTQDPTHSVCNLPQLESIPAQLQEVTTLSKPDRHFKTCSILYDNDALELFQLFLISNWRQIS